METWVLTYANRKFFAPTIEAEDPSDFIDKRIELHADRSRYFVEYLTDQYNVYRNCRDGATRLMAVYMIN